MRFYSSSAISQADYDERSRVLTIWFVESGGPYDYYNVPPHIYDGLCTATSKGTYFNDHIRDVYSDRR